MCGCIGHTVCGYHIELITDLIERLDVAERNGDDEARSLRGELAAYGRKAEIVRHKMRMETAR